MRIFHVAILVSFQACALGQTYSLLRTGTNTGIDTMRASISKNVGGATFYYNHQTGQTNYFPGLQANFRDMRSDGTAMYSYGTTQNGIQTGFTFLYDGTSTIFLTGMNGEDASGLAFTQSGLVVGATIRSVGSQRLARPAIFNHSGESTALAFYSGGAYASAAVRGQSNDGSYIGAGTINSDYVEGVIRWANSSASPNRIFSYFGTSANINLSSAFTFDSNPIIANSQGSSPITFTRIINGNHVVLDTGGLSPKALKSDGTVIGIYQNSSGVIKNAYYTPGIGVVDFDTIMNQFPDHNFAYEFYDRLDDGTFIGYTRGINEARELSYLSIQAVPEPTTFLVGLSIATWTIRRKQSNK